MQNVFIVKCICYQDIKDTLVSFCTCCGNSQVFVYFTLKLSLTVSEAEEAGGLFCELNFSAIITHLLSSL